MILNRYNDLYHTNLSQINLQEIKTQCKDAYEFCDNASNDEVLEYEITAIHSQISNQMEPFINSIKQLFFELEKTYWLQINPRVTETLQDINWNEYKPF